MFIRAATSSETLTFPLLWRHELMSMVGKIRFYKLIGIVDYTNRAYGIQPQMGAHQQRLRVCIAYAAHANMPLKLAQVAFELSAEGVFSIS